MAEPPATSTQPPKLWYRQFLRSDDPDIDHEATEDYLTKTFTDAFGKSLFTPDATSGIYVGNLMSSDALVRHYFDNPSQYKVQTYAVMDGINVTWSEKIKEWFRPHLRFLYYVHSANVGAWNEGSLTLFIVGSPKLEGTSFDAFLQVASWDSTLQEFRFYAREAINWNDDEEIHPMGWVYMGRSSDAFSKEKSYLGAFNGHVNGALIMKELHSPWVHWNGSGADPTQCLSPDDKEYLLKFPYISTTNKPLGYVSAADELETTITPGVEKWFTRRMKNDFLSTDGKTPKANPDNIQRWIAHLLLTTTINITAAIKNTDATTPTFVAPPDLFYAVDAFSKVNLPPIANFKPSFSQTRYEQVVKKVGLATLAEIEQKDPMPEGYITLRVKGTIGGGPKSGDGYDVTTFMKVYDGEGDFPFLSLEASYEDLVGIMKLYKPPPGVPSLLSKEAVQALLCVDFPNPVYSWRRGVLMYYVPESTTYDSTKSTYDFEATFVNNVKGSPHANESGSPEAVFLDLYTQFTTNKQAANDMKKRVGKYLNVVKANISKPADDPSQVDYLEQYTKLAESRRRMYRPLPLDEFALTLPYALNIPQEDPMMLEMTESGEIEVMPQRGAEFLLKWRSTLWGVDPQIIPKPALNADGAVDFEKVESMTCPASGLPAIAGLHVDCSGSPRVNLAVKEDPPANFRARVRRGCPFANKRWIASDAVVARHLKRRL